MKYAAWVLLFAFLLFSFTPEDIILRAEKKLSSLKSIGSNFEQVYFSKSLSTPLREKGQFSYQKPGKMKWVYREPEEKVFLLKDEAFLFYLPEDNQLIKGSLASYSYEAEILELLTGTWQFSDRFLIQFSLPPDDSARAYQITLLPREEGEYSSIDLEIDKKTWLINKVAFRDWAGNTTEFLFSQVKTNISFPANLFELELPPGIEIIESQNFQKKLS